MVEIGPDQEAQGWDAVTPAYETTFEPFARLFAEEMLARHRPQAASRVLDVGAGPGILTVQAAQCGADVLAIDFSPGMVGRLRRRLADAHVANARAEVMDGQYLKIGDATFDYAYSNFALIFFPDIERGLAEMHRVLKAGGRAAVTSWGAPERVDVLRVLMRAVRTAIPDYPPPARPPVWLRLADPDRFSESFRRAGFRNVLVESVTRNWRVPSPEWLAQNIAGFSPGLSFIFEALGPERVRRVLDVLVDQLHDEFKDGNVSLRCEALLGLGEK